MTPPVIPMPSSINTTSPTSNFEALFDAALTKYAKRTGKGLASHPFTTMLDRCSSPDNVLVIFEEQAKAFDEFRNDDPKLIKWLRPVVDGLHALCTNIDAAVEETARSSHPPPKSNLSILMARYHSRSPSRERTEEEGEDTHTPVVSPPTPTYQPHEGQQYMPLPTTRPISSPLSSTERAPLFPLPSFQVAHYTPHKWVGRAKSTGAEAARALVS